jgi:hypothetical protein
MKSYSIFGERFTKEDDHACGEETPEISRACFLLKQTEEQHSSQRSERAATERYPLQRRFQGNIL